MNNFGGDWTKIKIEILVEYAKAYLMIMGKKRFFELLYFDGFAGSGLIVKDKAADTDITIGAAIRIIEIDQPRPFDRYYFVEKNPDNFRELEKRTKDAFPGKMIHPVCKDCNEKLGDLAEYLKKTENKNTKTLAYIDPCGMQVEWAAIEKLKDLSIDMWILVPTGMGVNRLLKKNGQISDSWLKKLEVFLGMDRSQIKEAFYNEKPTLFNDISDFEKVEKAVEKSAELYEKRLRDVFKFVSRPYELKNATNSTMYHLFLTSNQSVAVKIANDIVKKYNS